VLLEQGCDAMQGYLFSRPVPPDQLVPFLTTRPPARKSGQRLRSA
jgi:EAL domain-containing protein (putative c-di-GMP-specific phosphodiesterase class I)